MSDAADIEETQLRRPVVRLKPKGGRRLAAGAPWVYADEIVMDRRTRTAAPGVVATLESAERRPLATVAFNPNSTISARVLDVDPEADIGVEWIAARLASALKLRTVLYSEPFYRLVHAEGDGLPGLVIDRFGEAVAVQPNAAWTDAKLKEIVEALDALIAPQAVVVNAGSRARSAEGLEGETRVLRGSVEGPVEVPMNGAIYLADLSEGQKTGLFYDQRPNHAFVARLSEGRDVLDVFSHVGGFGLAALAAGAASATAVDGSAAALDLAEEGARRMGVAERFHTIKAQAFDAMKALDDEGRRFGVVICDPPAFAPNRAAADKGARAYEKVARLGARLVEPGGFLTLCSCSHAVEAERFRQACARGIAQAGRQAALIRSGTAGPDHPVHAALPETGYLKALTWRLLG